MLRLRSNAGREPPAERTDATEPVARSVNPQRRWDAASELLNLGSINLTDRRISIILDCVADVTKTPRQAIVGRSKLWRYTRPRQIACAMLRRYTDLPWQRIAEAVGRSDHTTARNAVQCYATVIQQDSQYAEMCARIEARLGIAFKGTARHE